MAKGLLEWCQRLELAIVYQWPKGRQDSDQRREERKCGRKTKVGQGKDLTRRQWV